MKKLMIVLMAFSALSVYAKDADEKISKIRDVIESHETSIDNYHYGRLKGYLEGMNIRDGFKVTTRVDEMTYRMNLFALKKIVSGALNVYPEVELNDLIRSVDITGVRNSLGKCMLDDNGRLTLGLREFIGEEAKKYTYPIIKKCTIDLIELIEAQNLKLKR